MRGALLTAVVLLGLDLVLTTQAARIPALFVPVTNGLKNWMDPTVPLIADRAGAASSTGTAAAAGKGPPGEKKPVAGHCPPGWLPDPRHPGHCIQILA